MIGQITENQPAGCACRTLRTGRWLVLWLTLLLLIPFLGKAFHIDDPLFLWSADQIRRDPLRPYSFPVNWYGPSHSMANVMQNPPLHAYFLAAVGALIGSSEWAVHLAMLLPTVLCLLAVYDLAARLGADPVMAAVCTLVTPVFLVSASTAMCDVPMLTFWCWACAFWVRGIDESRQRWLAAAAVCAGLAGLTKYFGVACVPLLLAHGLACRRSLGLRLLWLAVPVAMYGVWSWWSEELYGVSHLLQAVQYRQANGTSPSVVAPIAVGLSFAGGGLLLPLFLAWTIPGRRRTLFTAIGLTALVLSGVSISGGVPWRVSPGWLQLGQWCVFVFGGVWILVAAVEHLVRFRDAAAILVALWIFGTFCFAAFFNWTVAGRTVLPLAPALALLLARESSALPSLPRWHMRWPTIVVAAVALLVTWADFQWAASARTAAREIARDCRQSGHSLWFVGHWGLQYYLQQEGARPLRFLTADASGETGTAVILEDNSRPRVLRLSTPRIGPDDRVLRPLNNTNVPSSVDGMTLVERRDYPCGSGVALMQSELGAGFYASIRGPLPFGFGNVPAQSYELLKLGP